MNKILSLLVVFIIISCNQEPKSDSEEEKTPTPETLSVKDSISLEIKQLGADTYFNGLAVAIVDSAGILYEEGMGFADVKTNRPYTTTTIQPIASVSKTFIGIALMKAQEEGLLNLDDPINMYLPFEVVNPQHPNDTITIRQLATHTSTVVDSENYMDRSYVLKDEVDSVSAQNENIPQSFQPKHTKIPLSDFLKNYLSVDGDWYAENAFSTNQPGQLFEYSNVGASLAAYIIEIVAKQPFSEYTKTHILNPLGMSNSGWNYDDVDFEKVSTLYSNPNTIVPYYSLITYPDGGFITCIHDLGKYLSELIRGYSGNGTLLSQESYAELFKKQLAEENFTERDPNHPYDDEYNTGLFMGFSALDNIGHTGGDPGVSSLMFFNAESGIGRILLVNTNIENQEGLNTYYTIFDNMKEFAARLK